MNKTLIVSSADSKYSQLLIELYKSVEGINGFDFAVLDCGLSENSKIFSIKEVSVVKFQIGNLKFLIIKLEVATI